MSVKRTQEQIIALGRLNLSEVIAYSTWLEVFYETKIVSKDMIRTLKNHCQEINECLPIVPTYFENTLPYLRKSRKILNLLKQRQKGTDYSNPQLDALFAENLQNLDDFFQRFDLHTEELSSTTSSPSSSDDVQRPLHQRIVNPDLDESRDFKNTISKMAKTAKSTKESSAEWKQLAEGILHDYETLDTKPTNYQVAEAELFLEGVNRLYERKRQQRLSEQKAIHLSTIDETPEEAKKRKRKNLLNSIADSLINDEQRTHN